MSFQSYEPLRSSILSKEDFKRLNEPRPLIAVRDTLVAWAIIVGAWALVAHFTYWWVVLLAIPVIGTQYYALHIIGHDGLHRRLFSSNKHNDLFASVFIHAPIFAITRINRVNHMVHHRETSTKEDPDRHKYSHHGKSTKGGFLLFLMGLANLVPTLSNIFLPDKGDSSKPKEGRTLLETLLILGWQLGLFAGLTWAIGWWAYPVLWILPVYIFTFVGDLLRVFCEHSMLSDDDEADKSLRLITYTSNPVELLVFAPHNMNYHAAHHLWPSIPYYNLPEADAAIQSCSFKDKFVWRKSYLGYIFQYAKQYLGKNSANGEKYAG